MDDMAIYEALASAALRRCGTDYRQVRRALAPLEEAFTSTKSAAARQGIWLMVHRLRARLEELQPDLPSWSGE